MIAVVAETKDGSARKITLEMLAEARRLAGAKGRPIFAGKAFARVAWSASRPQVASVRPNTFTPSTPDPSRKAAVETIALGDVKVRARVVGFEASEGETADLTEANIIVSGGRAM